MVIVLTTHDTLLLRGSNGKVGKIIRGQVGSKVIYF